MKRLHKKTIISIILILISIILLAISRKCTPFANWYALNIYSLLQIAISHITGLAKFSLFEFLIIMTGFWLIGAILKNLILLIKFHKSTNREFFSRPFYKGLRNLLCFISCIMLVFTLTCGINYGREPFSQYCGFEIKEHSKDELVRLATLLINDANSCVPDLTLDKDGIFTLDNIDAIEEAASCMSSLGDKYDVLDGWYPKPKPVAFSKVMTYQFITGIYSPFTIEANYNDDVPDSEKPYVMCHELSHLKGFMREDEAEFIAYLACMGSDTVEFRYSATLGALTYVMNSVNKNCSKEQYAELYRTLNEQTLKDLLNVSSYWSDYNSNVAVAANAVNNAYLRANNQTDGVHSYGRMIDLLLAYYSDTISK